MERMTRLPDWPERLAAFIDAAQRRRFAWGIWDCGQAALGAFDAQTGFDARTPWCGYDDEDGAYDLLFEKGSGSFLNAVRQTGLTMKPKRTAGRGDIVLFESDPDAGLRGLSLGFVDLSGLAVLAPAPDRDGLIRFKRSAIRTAWGFD